MNPVTSEMCWIYFQALCGIISLLPRAVMKAVRVYIFKMQNIYRGWLNDVSVIIINISDVFYGNKAAVVLE